MLTNEMKSTKNQTEIKRKKIVQVTRGFVRACVRVENRHHRHDRRHKGAARLRLLRRGVLCECFALVSREAQNAIFESNSPARISSFVRL